MFNSLFSRRIWVGRCLLTFLAPALIANGQDPDNVCALLESQSDAPLSAVTLAALEQSCKNEPERAMSPVGPSIPAPLFGVAGANIQVNMNPDDVVAAAAGSTTQSQPSMAMHNGAIVAGWNDSSHGLLSMSYSGYGVSLDGGQTWIDRGFLPIDPAPVSPVTKRNVGNAWVRVHHRTGNFYYATIGVPVVGLQNFRVVVYTGASPWSIPDWPGLMDATPLKPGIADRPAMAVDNSGGPFDGRVYICYRQFGGVGNGMKMSVNDTVGVDQPLSHVAVRDLTVAGTGAINTGCAVEVDQRNGDVYVVWENFLNPRSIQARRSTDGGATFGPAVTAASLDFIGHLTTCQDIRCAGRLVLDGDIGVTEFATGMTFSETTGNMHFVFASNPDGPGLDESDAYHVRCSPTGANSIGYCTPPKRLSDDATLTDQWNPYIDSTENGQLSAFWYDRRNDSAANNLIDVYKTFSTDDGVTWSPNERVTEVSFDVPPLCPIYDSAVSACYMGDYNHVTSDEDFFYFIWGDNRNLISERPDPDVFFEKQPAPPREARLSSTQKGSLLVFSKIEIKWSGDGSTLLQDTFLDFSNNYPDSVFVQGYFINGDKPLEEICAAQPCTGANLIQSMEPGWNTADCRFELTANQPHYWSAAHGSDKCQSFVVLDDDGPGRSDPETNGATRVLRGYAIFYAVDFNPDPLVGDVGAWEEIAWNHLKGDAVVVNYAEGSAWEYNAWASQARAAEHGQRLPTPGVLNLDGIEFEAPYDTLLMDFYGDGSTVLSRNGEQVSVMTDLTVHPVSADLRQDGCGPVMTKVEAQIWNEFESKFSGARRCICCWDQTMLADWSPFEGIPNHFLRTVLGTDKGKARLEGVESIECDYSTVCGLDALEVLSRPMCEGPNAGVNGFSRLASKNAALLGLTTKFLAFGSGDAKRDASGLNLTGSGTQSAAIQVDVATGPPEARYGSQPRGHERSSRSRSTK